MIKIEVPGEPVAKARARYAARQVKGKYMAMAYTPKKTKDAEAVIVEKILEQVARQNFGIDYPLSCWLYFYMPIKKYMKNKVKPFDAHIKKPDDDNLEKLAKDALTKSGLIVDDSIICETHKIKIYSESPSTTIFLEEFSPVAAQWRMSPYAKTP